MISVFLFIYLQQIGLSCSKLNVKCTEFRFVQNLFRVKHYNNYIQYMPKFIYFIKAGIKLLANTGYSINLHKFRHKLTHTKFITEYIELRYVKF